MLKRILVYCALLFSGVIAVNAQEVSHTFAFGDNDFLLDGNPLQMISGEMHYTRIPRESWRERIKMAKAMGLNTIGTYVFWNAHEPVQGKYDFTGNNDIAEFVRIAKEEGMWVVMRPSPYVCAEWEFGGYPWWLLKDKTLKVRSKEPAFINAYRNYMMEVGKQLAPLQVNHGGNILMVQIENEYGSFSNDKEYLAQNEKIFREAGFDGLLFTCDGATQMPAGYLPGFLPAVNGEDNPAKVKELINKYHNGKGPYYIAEWYPGWFDSWGKPHTGSNADEDSKKLDEVLSAGISINMYMFHGGTTRDFMNGANMSRTEAYAPQTSSYDYDAPLDEAGNPTPKYYKLRAVIAKHLPAGQTLPDVPERKHRTFGLEVIKFSGVANLFSNLGKSVEAEKPMSFEDIDQGYGFVLYRTTLKNAASGLLKIKELRDYATVYLNGKRISVLDRRLRLDSLQLNSTTPNSVLDILVENNGRINYGPYLTDNRQGITEKVTLNGQELLGWKMYKFPFTTTAGFKYLSVQNQTELQPALYRGTFSLRGVVDTYLDMKSFGKGFVFINGHNLGKYWNIGPQQTLYVPAAWLKKGVNEVVLFDQLKGGHTELSTLDHSVLNQVVKE
ncbi:MULTISPECIES: beta-galactosidase family protein [unclassified Mucilaginibacter]|uniref:glycoside hydrolase family 35 protein n=1 Tax=unclassified Mucilaginibacter TaxID=2617802 RepID=UPI002AC8A69E|nr:MULTISPECIES: beta-galactosidase family protein [unclassified Mucilaginibacter]MEB0262453.1 beta-galactosidase [Mucilaginibacter sp. 10I4]MEB0279278.1 beta-galactosidase [Mucilaginibacter sp. 10B2]MEB0302584.1 beta-galactosidase [Mucilaginibacter sp. 5C4]WPX23210.1 beta-galactosidase [Mucilaginibacter sp. 5C4]